MLEKKVGKVKRIIFSADNGYTVAEFETNEEFFNLTGYFHSLGPGKSLSIEGEFVTHKKFGEQFKVSSYEEILPTTANSMREFLAYGGIKGVGPKTANAMVDAFGDKTFDVIENDPKQLLSISGIGVKTLSSIVESFMDKIEYAKIQPELRRLGLNEAQSISAYNIYGSDSIEIIKENPYCLADDIRGISFKNADIIAYKMGQPQDSKYRIKSGIKFILSTYISTGSTCVAKDTLIDDGINLLDISSEKIEESLVSMAFEGVIQTEEFDGVTVIYLYGYYRAEQRIASNIKRIKEASVKPIPFEIKDLISDAEKKESISLSEEQKMAVTEAFLNNMTIITGGPGTGKTTIINTIIKIVDRCKLKKAVAAPTGRAAKRITETSGALAMTIHRLLEYVYSEDNSYMEFARNGENQLDADVIIIDEASMIDLMLMDGLLEAIKSGSRLIVVGDADQLPSVGAGNVLKDMISSEYIRTMKLKEIFRQAEESMIVVNAHRINQGEYPLANESDNDFFMMEKNKDDEILETIKELVGGRLEDYYDFIGSGMDIQVISPTKKGKLGTVALNTVLQEVLNPPSPIKKEKTFGSIVFREGDKVMQIKNNYSMEWKSTEDFQTGHGVFNGDMGVVDSINPESGKIIVIYDDRSVTYEAEDLEELELAYAITVHKSQGSEFNAMVMPMTSFSQALLTKDLLYTAVTRGKLLDVVVGKEKYLHDMVDNDRVDARKTTLKERLMQLDFGVFGD